MRRLLLAVLMVCGFSVLAEVRIFNYPEYKIYVIQDASNRFPASLFSSVDPQEKFVQTAKDYAGSVNVFIVEFKAEKKRVMIDAGFGAPKGKLLSEMKKAGIPPESISDILITHIHPDHIGGLADYPNAKLRIAREEYNAAASKSLAEKEKIALFEFDTEVVPKIKALKFAGHTPGHTVYQLETCFFVGDIVHATNLQIANPAFCARYDKNPAEAAASRKRALSELKGEWFGAHIPYPGHFVNPPPRMCVEHIALVVATPESTAKWWCENLGFHIVARLPVPPYAIFIASSSGQFVIELYRNIKPRAPNRHKMSMDNMHIAFASDDLDGDVRRLTAAGATLVFRIKNSGNELIMLRDPSGIPIQLLKRTGPLIKPDFGEKNASPMD